MDVGMLWYDGEQGSSLGERIRQAADYYRSKYGKDPDLCMVNPSLREEGLPRQLGELQIRTHQSVLKHHFWLGVQGEG
jgi:hypothetical protein